MKKLDLSYLCSTIGSLCGFPVRLYEGNELKDTARADENGRAVFDVYYETGAARFHTYTVRQLDPEKEGVTWEDGFSSSDVRILCYNRQYVERFFRMEDRIPGIFSTQGIDREAHERIRVLKGQIDEKMLAVSGCENKLRDLEDSQAAALDVLKKSCWRGAAGFRKEYAAALRGGLSNSEKFTKRLLKTLEAGGRSGGSRSGRSPGRARTSGTRSCRS